MKGSIFTLIKTNYHSLSQTQKSIADYIMLKPQKVISYSINDLASKCNTSETTIFRFLNKIGYGSYQIFKIKIAQEISSNSTKSIYGEIKPDDNIDILKKKVIELTTSSINGVSPTFPKCWRHSIK